MPLELTIRPLEAEEINLPAKPQTLAKLTHRHHTLAKCIVSGLSLKESCIISGFKEERAYGLKKDPMFKDLLNFYTQRKQEYFTDTFEKLADLTSSAVDTLRDRIDNTPDKISTKDLISILTSAADRSGNSPTIKTENKNLNISVGLEEARARLAKATKG